MICTNDDLINALKHVADDHPCCAGTLLEAADRLKTLDSFELATRWQCVCGGTDCEGQKENAALRALLKEAADYLDPTDAPCRREGPLVARILAKLQEGQP